MVQILLVAAYVALAIVLYLLLSKPNPALPPVAGGRLPLIGHVYQLVQNTEQFFLNAHQKYNGMYVIKIFWQTVVVISDRKLFNDYYRAREHDLSFHEPLRKIGIMQATWGVDHSPMSDLNVTVMKKMVGEKWEPVVREQTQITLDEFTKSDQGEINLNLFARRAVARIISVVLLGFDYGEEIRNKMSQFEVIVIDAVKSSMILGRKLSTLLAEKKIAKLRHEIVTLLLPLVRKAIANPTSIFMRLLNEHRTENGAPIKETDLALMVNAVSFAALSNTSNATSNILYLAASHPDEVKKLRAEPIENPLWQAWCLETARMASGFLSSRRDVIKSELELGGYVFPAGTTFMADVKSESLLSKEFDAGVSNREFLPGRFLAPLSDESKKFGVMNWGAGIHVCPGKIFAVLEMKLILQTVISKINLLPPNKELKLKYEMANNMALIADNYVVGYEKLK